MNYKGYQIAREELVELGTGIRSHQWAVYIGGCPRGCDYQLGVFDTMREAKEYVNKQTMGNIFADLRHLAETFVADAEEFINKQKQYNNMKKQVKVTALTEEGGSIESGWFKDLNKGEEYAAVMAARGYVVVKQYR